MTAPTPSTDFLPPIEEEGSFGYLGGLPLLELFLKTGDARVMAVVHRMKDYSPKQVEDAIARVSNAIKVGAQAGHWEMVAQVREALLTPGTSWSQHEEVRVYMDGAVWHEAMTQKGVSRAILDRLDRDASWWTSTSDISAMAPAFLGWLVGKYPTLVDCSTMTFPDVAGICLKAAQEGEKTLDALTQGWMRNFPNRGDVELAVFQGVHQLLKEERPDLDTVGVLMHYVGPWCGVFLQVPELVKLVGRPDLLACVAQGWEDTTYKWEMHVDDTGSAVSKLREKLRVQDLDALWKAGFPLENIRINDGGLGHVLVALGAGGSNEHMRWMALCCPELAFIQNRQGVCVVDMPNVDEAMVALLHASRSHQQAQALGQTPPAPTSGRSLRL